MPPKKAIVGYNVESSSKPDRGAFVQASPAGVKEEVDEVAYAIGCKR